MPLAAEVRDFYAHPAKMTAPGSHARALDGLPDGIDSLCKVTQGVLLHQHWAQAYRQKLSRERMAESQIRTASHMISQIFSHDARPLSDERDPAKRTVGVCRHFAVLTVSMLRHKGVPARARCGFGAYFNAGKFEDHWVVEYWSDSEARWVLVDSQIDGLQAGILQPDFPLLDVPRDKFVIAGDAWLKCRDDEADFGAFGIFDMRGDWFVAGNVLRDFAALNNMEMLPWDSWGVMTGPDRPLQEDTLDLVDHVATLTLDSDARFTELGAVYGNDERLRVPAMVFNVQNKQLENV